MATTQTITERVAAVRYYHTDRGLDGSTHPSLMTTNGADDVLARTLAEMRAQDYVIVEVLVSDICPACQGHGRIASKRRTRLLPVYRECPACHGAAWLNERHYLDTEN
jgi:hypothetical protein